jgi:DNA ligase 1
LKSFDTLRELKDPDFCPVKDSPQCYGQRMPFGFLVKALGIIEETTGKNSRTVVVETICNVFRSALVNYPSEMPDLYYFFIVKLAPDFIMMETGIGHEVSIKAIAKACGKLPKDIREQYKDLGDLGIVAQKGKKN